MTTSPTTPKLPRQLVNEYYEHSRALKAAVLLPDTGVFDTEALKNPPEFDPVAYRQVVSNVLSDFKACTVEIAQSGHQDCFAVLGIHSAELISALSQVLRTDALRIALEEISAFFPVSSDFLLAIRTTTFKAALPAIPVVMLKQAVMGNDKPFELLDTYIAATKDDEVLPMLFAGIESVMPLSSREDLRNVARLFDRLGWLLDERSNIPDAVEWFAANQGTLLPIIADVLAEAKLLYSDVSSSKKDKSLIYMLSFSSEFLCALNASTNHPVVAELGSLALELPRGYMAYTYLDSMGLAQTQEWHAQAQVDADWRQLVKLHEYAMVNKGFELDLSQLRKMDGQFSMGAARLYIDLLANTPAVTDDAKGKQAMIFDALVKQCKDHDFGDKIKALIINSNIPKELFKSHLNLLGDRFHQDLGL